MLSGLVAICNLVSIIARQPSSHEGFTHVLRLRTRPLKGSPLQGRGEGDGLYVPTMLAACISRLSMIRDLTSSLQRLSRPIRTHRPSSEGPVS